MLPEAKHTLQSFYTTEYYIICQGIFPVLQLEFYNYEAIVSIHIRVTGRVVMVNGWRFLELIEEGEE